MNRNTQPQKAETEPMRRRVQTGKRLNRTEKAALAAAKREMKLRRQHAR